MDPELLKILSSLFMIVAVPVFTVLAGYLAKLAKVYVAKLEAQLKEKNPGLEYWLDWAADLAVNAAEVSGLNDYALDKKQAAYELMEKFLSEKGLVIDIDLIDAAIEKAWLESYGEEKMASAKAKKLAAAKK